MRPDKLLIGNVLYWVIRTRDPDTQVLKDADSTPTVAIRKNGASTADSVTITKRAATTGIYDCEYNPAGEVEGDSFTAEESATVTGTTTGAATYENSWMFMVLPAVVDANLVQINGEGGFVNQLNNSLEEGVLNNDTGAIADQIAARTRINLATELGRIDSTISSRADTGTVNDLAQSIPTASVIAAAVSQEIVIPPLFING